MYIKKENESRTGLSVAGTIGCHSILSLVVVVVLYVIALQYDI